MLSHCLHLARNSDGYGSHLDQLVVCNHWLGEKHHTPAGVAAMFDCNVECDEMPPWMASSVDTKEPAAILRHAEAYEGAEDPSAYLCLAVHTCIVQVSSGHASLGLGV